MKRLRNILPLLVILGGMLILFYPTISNFLIMRNASRAVNNYDASVEALSQEQYQKVLDAAHAYNEKLAQNDAGETDVLASAVNSASTDEEYNSLLNIDGDGMMGYITVPKLEETLPIYHGTSEKVLQSGIGHLEQTSLPVGGASTHAALSGHRGLPTAKLFTDLNLMKKGDKFYITILKDTYAYQVDKITTVLPTDTKQLAIEPGKDWSRSSLVRRMRSIRIGCWCVAIASHTRRSTKMTPNPRSTWTFRCSTGCRLLH